MKKKKIISAIILFGLALSSCKDCCYNRDTPPDLTTLNRLISELHSGAVKNTFVTASEALKHAADAIDNSARGDKCTCSAICYLTDSANRSRLIAAADVTYHHVAADAAFYATIYAEYVFARVVGKDNPNYHCDRSYWLRIIGGPKAAAEVASCAREAKAKAADAAACAADELAKKIEELKELFKDWESWESKHPKH